MSRCRLTLHPDVTIMGAKEIKWWSNTPLSSNDIYDFERYLDIADIAVSQILKEKRANYVTNMTQYPMIFGDATPSTMFDNIQWVCNIMHQELFLSSFTLLKLN